MNIRTNFKEFAPNFNIDPLEAAVMDVARAIQITPTMQDEADRHFRGLAKHVDRPGSPLEDKVQEIYPSGSFAIHTATRSRLKTNQHDVDAVLEISVPPATSPEWMLTQLYTAIKGAKGSKYFDYPIQKNSRCVTVTYPDGVTVDLMPVVRLAGTPERVATLFHYKSESGEQYHKEINPKGFANHFNKCVETSETFQMRFDARRYLVEGETFTDQAKRLSNETRTLIMDKADTQPMPVYVPLDQKSPRVVALQLIKAFRDKRYRKHDDHRGKRKPPSVIMAAIAIDAGPVSDSLVDEVIAIAKCMRRQILHAERNLQLLEVRNPSHYPDIFTDRWPAQRSDQQLWAADLLTLIESLEHLKRVNFDPIEIQTRFNDLFGETAGETALRDYHHAQTIQLEHGALGMTPRGQLKSATPDMTLTAPVLGSHVTSPFDLVKPARPNTNMGGTVPDDNSW
jgi:hypothetical protein